MDKVQIYLLVIAAVTFLVNVFKNGELVNDNLEFGLARFVFYVVVNLPPFGRIFEWW